jgi:hypothetical protein
MPGARLAAEAERLRWRDVSDDARVLTISHTLEMNMGGRLCSPADDP